MKGLKVTLTVDKTLERLICCCGERGLRRRSEWWGGEGVGVGGGGRRRNGSRGLCDLHACCNVSLRVEGATRTVGALNDEVNATAAVLITPS